MIKRTRILALLTIAALVPAWWSAAVAQAHPASPAAATPQAKASAHADVLAVRVNPDGTTSVASYSPPPGVTAAELYQGLKAEGVAGLRDPSKPPITTMDPFSCYWGTSYALENGRCPAISWRPAGRARPLVHFNDHSSQFWPVGAAAAKWNESCCIDVSAAVDWCSTASGAHCVHVYSGQYGKTLPDGQPKWVGRTEWTYDSQRAFIEARIYLNDSYNTYTANRYRKTTCHELGHAIGIGHSVSPSSCMISGAYDALYPSGDDWLLLEHVIY